MKFITFIQHNESRYKEDKDLQSFSWYVKINKSDALLSSNPYILSFFLYNKLNPQQTQGFQKWMMLYYHEPKNMLPKELKNDMEQFAEAVNTIINFQIYGVRMPWCSGLLHTPVFAVSELTKVQKGMFTPLFVLIIIFAFLWYCGS